LYIQFLPWVIAVGPYIALYLACMWVIIHWDEIKKWYKNEPSPETQRIAILGTMGGGKTTLWKRLKGEPCSKNDSYHPTDTKKEYKSFVMQGTNITIIEGIDIRGDDLTADKFYDQVLDKDKKTFIYFLFDISKFLNNKKERKDVADYLCRVSKILFEKNGDAENLDGFCLVGTHADKTGLTGVEVRDRFVKESKFFEKFNDALIVGDLYDDAFIESIKSKIVQYHQDQKHAETQQKS